MPCVQQQDEDRADPYAVRGQVTFPRASEHESGRPNVHGSFGSYSTISSKYTPRDVQDAVTLDRPPLSLTSTSGFPFDAPHHFDHYVIGRTMILKTGERVASQRKNGWGASTNYRLDPRREQTEATAFVDAKLVFYNPVLTFLVFFVGKIEGNTTDTL